MSRRWSEEEREKAVWKVKTLTPFHCSMATLREADGESIENVAVYLAMELDAAVELLKEYRRLDFRGSPFQLPSVVHLMDVDLFIERNEELEYVEGKG